MTAMTSPRASILLIYTGGTIGMKTDPATGALAPFDFNGIYEEFPYLGKLSVRIDVLPFTPIDSSNVTPELWVQLAGIIASHYDRYDGFVILHGTDTMAYSASALSFMLENLAKPVVFTGSQIPIGVLRTDGRENLITAIEIAAAQDAGGRAMVPEVSICFQNRLLRANRTTKYSAEKLNAFRSDNYPPLAEVGVNIHYHIPYIYSVPEPGAPLETFTELDDRVGVIRVFPGLRPDMLRGMLSLEGLRAVVLETYGSGNAPTAEWFLRAVADAVAGGLIVMNVTQCHDGAVAMDLYETGRRLKQAGVVSGHDITTESALAKLMVLLGRNLPRTDLDRLLIQPIRGEITP